MRRTVLVMIVLCALVISAPVALANDSAVGTQGAAVRPLTDTDIRMDSEAVQIICMRGYALYRIDFKFVNGSGADKALKIGFPFPDFENEEGNRGVPPAAFRAWLNGQELAVTQEPGFDSDGDAEWPVIWFTREAVFPPGESMMTVTYLGTPDVSVMSAELAEALSQAGSEASGAGFYPYLVHTGAGWAGTIGKTVVRYTMAEDFDGEQVDLVMETEAGYEWTEPGRARLLRAFTKPAPNVYEWVYEDYEPTRDHDPLLAFAWFSEWTQEFDPFEATKASSHLELGEYTYQPYAIRDGQPSTAWAEDADGPGIGEWVDIGFGESRDVREIRVLPGYQKRADLFAKYNRPKTLKVDFSDGTGVELPLADEMGLQVFTVRAKADSARVTIVDVYPGTNERDETYISEVTFSEAPLPKLATFEAVTGIAPPAAFEEPAALAQLTDLSGSLPDPGKPAQSEEETAEAQPTGAGTKPYLGALIAVGLLATAAVIVVGVRRGAK